MERTPVQSSNIAAVGYDASAQALEVQFHNGGVFTYHGVDPELHAGFMGSESKGKFLHQKIRTACQCSKGGLHDHANEEPASTP